MKKPVLLSVFLATIAGPAWAHHPLGGMPMETFAHGILSGIGHPVLGFDHLFFVILVGIAALFTSRPRMAPAAYILAMLAGCMMIFSGSALPATEVIVGLSLLVLGGLVLSGRAMGAGTAMAIFAGFGLFHGAAFGASIAGQEATLGAPVLIAYLIGLGFVQFGIALLAGWVASTVFHATEATAISARLAGAVVAGVGLFLTLENVEAFVFSQFNWAA